MSNNSPPLFFCLKLSFTFFLSFSFKLLSAEPGFSLENAASEKNLEEFCPVE